MKQFTFFILICFAVPVQAQTSFTDTTEMLEFTRQIEHSSIVALGETGHGYETINEAKSAFAGVLQEKFNFTAISFESSFTESIVSFLVDSTVNARARNFLYPFWNTTSVKTALASFLSREKDKPLIIGFDIQEDCRFNKLSQLLLNKHLVSANKDRLIQCDSILSCYIGKHISRKGAITQQEYALLIHNYEFIQTEITTKEFSPVHKKLLERCIENRKWLCKYLTLTTAKEKMYYRDSLMAANIIWLKRELYADNKLIVWAANTHIAKSTSPNSAEWMGEWLTITYRDQYFAIAFEKGFASNTLSWTKTPYRYFSSPYKKFNLVIYLDKLTKIKSAEWITPCD